MRRKPVSSVYQIVLSQGPSTRPNGKVPGILYSATLFGCERGQRADRVVKPLGKPQSPSGHYELTTHLDPNFFPLIKEGSPVRAGWRGSKRLRRRACRGQRRPGAGRDGERSPGPGGSRRRTPAVASRSPQLCRRCGSRSGRGAGCGRSEQRPGRRVRGPGRGGGAEAQQFLRLSGRAGEPVK
jgi:hypothetical protein